MKIDATREFEKDVKRLPKMVQQKLAEVMLKLQKVHDLDGISNVKKLSVKSYYRIRIIDYRIGFKLVNTDTLLFLTAKHRSEVYDFFPPKIGFFYLT
jgi:mRNA-degrading endonuclease RelE of RelBE toxin-antitoxin system